MAADSKEVKEVGDSKYPAEVLHLIEHYLQSFSKYEATPENLETLRKQLRQDINTPLKRSFREERLLTYYVQNGMRTEVLILLKNGADPNVIYTCHFHTHDSVDTVVPYSNTPLLHAVLTLDAPMVTILIKHGADVNKKADLCTGRNDPFNIYRDMTPLMCFYKSQETKLRHKLFAVKELAMLELLLAQDASLSLRAVSDTLSRYGEPETILDMTYLGPEKGFNDDSFTYYIVQKTDGLIQAHKKVLEDNTRFSSTLVDLTLEYEDRHPLFGENAFSARTDLTIPRQRDQDIFRTHFLSLAAKLRGEKVDAKPDVTAGTKLDEKDSMEHLKLKLAALEEKVRLLEKQLAATATQSLASNAAPTNQSNAQEMLKGFEAEKRRQLSQGETVQPAVVSQQSSQPPQTAATTTISSQNRPTKPAGV